MTSAQTTETHPRPPLPLCRVRGPRPSHPVPGNLWTPCLGTVSLQTLPEDPPRKREARAALGTPTEAARHISIQSE